MLQVSRLAALIGLLGLGLPAAHAQLLPPNGYFEWSGNGGDGLWQTGTNWIGGPNGLGGEPTINADVLFANAPPANNPEGNPYQEPITVNHNTSQSINSLWFETGREYTIRGSSLQLGGSLADGGHLIAGLNTDPSKWQSEHNIDASINIQLARSEWTAEIASYSAGGLGIGGDLTFTRGNLRQTGGGAIHIAGAMKSFASNPGNLTVATNAGHLILSGDNSGWRGNLTVNHGFLVATANNALGSTASGRTVSINGTWSGATLAFRPKFVGPGLNNSAGMNYSTAQSVTVTGKGYLRPWGAADPYDLYSTLNLAPVGAIYNDGGNNSFAGDITVLGETWFGSRHGVLNLTGRITQSGRARSFTKVGHGVVALGYNGTNGWTGNTVIREGTLRLGHTNSLATASVIRFEGGILELGAGNFSRTLGTTGTNRINWATGQSGGFSAYGGERTVSLNNGATLTWGSGGFVGNGAALLLSSAYADNKITFANPINLGSSAYREIRVERGATSAAHAVLSGQIFSQTGGILKTGLGTLWLNNSQNAYRHITTIREGVLGGYVPSNSRIDFDGGVLGIDSNFTRPLGTFASQVRWLAGRDGGFASYYYDMMEPPASVTLGAAGSIVSFGQANFVSSSAFLIFGAYDAFGAVVFNNRIGLLGTPTTGIQKDRERNHIRVISGTHNGSRADVVFSRAFYGPSAQQYPEPTACNLFFEGDGRADITQNNAWQFEWFAMLVRTRGVELRVNQAGRLGNLHGNMRNEGGVWVHIPSILRAEWGGTVTLDNQGSYDSLNANGQSVANRLSDQVTIALNAGNFRLWGGTQNLVETAGALRLEGGANTLQVRGPLPIGGIIYIGSTRLHLSKLVYDGFQFQFPTIDFVGVRPPNRFGGGTMLTFAEAPNEINGILPYATVNGTDWARTQTQGGLNYLTAYTGYQTDGQTTWTSITVNASPTNNVVLSTDRSLNSLRLTSGRQVNLGSHNLVLDSGGLLATGTATTYLSGGTLLRPPLRAHEPLYVHVYNTAAVGLNISSTIGSTTLGHQVLIKIGPGLLLLSGGGEAYFGNIYVHQGTLALGKTITNYLGRMIDVGDRSGTDILRIDRAEQIANWATVTLRGGHPDPSRFLMAEGILQFNGINGSGVGIRETIGNLIVEGRGVIDFRGGSGAHANYLIINGSLIIGADSRLFIRNWYEFEDYILINRENASSVVLDRITFEGYGPAIFRPWDGNYYQITPMPEPATYGAILGVVGMGLWGWHNKRRRRPRDVVRLNRTSRQRVAQLAPSQRIQVYKWGRVHGLNVNKKESLRSELTTRPTL